MEASMGWVDTPLGVFVEKSYWLATIAEIPSALRSDRVLRRFRKLESPDKAEIFATAEKLLIGQRRSEVEWVADLIQTHSVRALVEIGTQRGGNDLLPRAVHAPRLSPRHR
jgi:hypothetical protein